MKNILKMEKLENSKAKPSFDNFAINQFNLTENYSLKLKAIYFLRNFHYLSFILLSTYAKLD